MTRVIALDFEGASVPDLKDVGTVVWTKHKDTQPILCGYALDEADPKVIALPLLTDALLQGEEGEPLDAPEAKQTHVNTLKARANEAELLDAVEDPAVEIHAWNANFEFNFWNHVCAPKFGWPQLPIERFHCTMAAASLAGLPQKLVDAGKAVGAAVLKDQAGHRQMLMMARPRKVDPDGFIHWWHIEDAAKVAQLIQYNLNDVRAERSIGEMIPRMGRRERAIWLTDQRMNMRGLPVDDELLAALDGITLQETLNISAAINRITAGAVTSFAQVGKLLAWLQARGYPLVDLQRDTLDGFIGTLTFRSLDDAAQQVLQLRLEAAKTSTKKLISIGLYSPDGYAQNLIQYGGAARTMRWAGRGPQIQNLPRPAIKVENIALAIDEILDGADADTLRLLYGNPLDVVSSCIRGVFKAPSGSLLGVCDYTSIEAIVLAWLAEFDELLDVFRRGEDVYAYTAAAIGSSSRQLGKVMRLALGFGMGPAKFQDTAAKSKIALTIAEATSNVNAFRNANAPIVKLWHGCEAMAKKAILNPGCEFTFQRLKFRMADPKKRLARALLMELPSGRKLVYRDVRLDNGEIRFWGVDQYRKIWCELKTYGGKLVENATQAVARDLLAEAIVEIDQRWPDTLCTTVHDEIIAMTSEPCADLLLDAMRHVMSNPPAWANGMPVSCKGVITERYGKL